MSACADCLRRTRLVADLACYLDHLHAARGLLDEVFALSDADLVDALVPAGPARTRILAARDRMDPDVERDRVRAAGLDAVCRHDPAYPRALADLAGPPAVLHLRTAERLGRLAEGPAVAIVGPRRASDYGLEVARSLARGLAAAGVTVVSGMALGVDSAAHEGALDATARTMAGVDSAAHEGALEATARTVAVLGSGADVAYPATKRALHARLGEVAVVLSELPPGFRPRRWTFPARNRIIAGLAALTIVVEAADRSGALITARTARDLGRDVAAVPGQITSPLAAGPNALLRDGAHVVDGPQAALDLLFGAGARRAHVPGDHDLEPRLAHVLRAVREGRGTVAALAAGTPPAATLAALGELELLGLVRRAAGGTWVARVHLTAS
ncbi:MAG: processing protein [Solirubrobacteraceae bacterium]|nr:processing protein [Solirubrobacteraceae bacterium]